MNMDDFIFLVNRLEDAQKIADEAISLFSNCAFKLLKTKANKGTKVVLLSIENDLLATFICDLLFVFCLF